MAAFLRFRLITLCAVAVLVSHQGVMGKSCAAVTHKVVIVFSDDRGANPVTSDGLPSDNSEVTKDGPPHEQAMQRYGSSFSSAQSEKT